MRKKCLFFVHIWETMDQEVRFMIKTATIFSNLQCKPILESLYQIHSLLQTIKNKPFSVTILFPWQKINVSQKKTCTLLADLSCIRMQVEIANCQPHEVVENESWQVTTILHIYTNTVTVWWHFNLNTNLVITWLEYKCHMYKDRFMTMVICLLS